MPLLRPFSSSPIRWKNCSSWAFFPPRTLVGRPALKPTPRVPRCSLVPPTLGAVLETSALWLASAPTRSRRSSQTRRALSRCQSPRTASSPTSSSACGTTCTSFSASAPWATPSGDSRVGLLPRELAGLGEGTLPPLLVSLPSAFKTLG